MKGRLGVQPLERWIDQYQFVGRRSLSDDEKEFLDSQISTARDPSNCFVTGLCAAATATLLVACGTGLIDRGLFGPILALSIVFASIVPLEWMQQLKAYREAMADIRLGDVEIFRTTPTSLRESWIVLLPRSHRLLSREGEFVRARIYLRVNGVALRRPRSVRPFPAQFAMTGGHISPVRTLNSFEKKELAGLLAKRCGWQWLLPSLLWGWTLIGLSYGNEFGFSSLTTIRVSLLTISAVSLTAYYLNRRRRMESVRHDLRRGTVICEQAGDFKFEHLVNSDLLWTVDSNPASWRKRSQRSWICPSI